jgi:hypothetical protein
LYIKRVYQTKTMNESHFARIIYRVSHFSILSATYALYRGHYDLALVPGGVFLTSIQYWSDPTNLTKRHIDMAYVTTALVYQIIRARGYEHASWYYGVVSLAVSMYPLSIYFQQKGNDEVSTFFHCLVHIFGNIANFVLYSGPSLNESNL